jgi:acetyl-CoA carboxylase carboxyl transferase subunit beta
VLKDVFGKKRKYATIPSEQAKKEVPEGLVLKCKQCSSILVSKELDKQMKVCTCGYHFPLSAPERIAYVMDEDSFVEYDADWSSVNLLAFEGYEEKLDKAKAASGLSEAVMTGEGRIEGNACVIGVMDSRFMMGSMGAVVGSKIANAILRAVEKRLPFILFSASGGARMQEGVISLMQMAKTTSALARLDEAGLLYISVMTNPTTGGVSASFASLGDINLAEPGALIGFAGRRIIEQTIRQKLPDNFQTAEFLLAHGQLDRVVPRQEMKPTLGRLLRLHAEGGY